MVSKAIRKSNRTHVNVSVLPCLICYVNSAEVSIVLRLLRKPNCFEESKFLLSKSACNRSYLVFSNFLQIPGNIEHGLLFLDYLVT